MKKRYKVCKNEDCGKSFLVTKFSAFHKHCSPACYYSCKSPTERKPIKKRCVSLAKEERIYNTESNKFLAFQSDDNCPVMFQIFGKLARVSLIHHKAGRGVLLNYKPFWLALSDEGHKWVHDHPEISYKLGFSIRRTTVNINELDL